MLVEMGLKKMEAHVVIVEWIVVGGHRSNRLCASRLNGCFPRVYREAKQRHILAGKGECEIEILARC